MLVKKTATSSRSCSLHFLRCVNVFYDVVDEIHQSIVLGIADLFILLDGQFAYTLSVASIGTY